MAKVLIVDDEPGYLELLRMILEADGHEVTTAETGDSAIELGHATSPDVLLADWMLRGRLNGIDVARALRAENPKLAVIMITGYAETQLTAATDDLKALQVLGKPFGEETIRNLVRESAGISHRRPT